MEYFCFFNVIEVKNLTTIFDSKQTLKKHFFGEHEFTRIASQYITRFNRNTCKSKLYFVGILVFFFFA